VDGVPTLLGLSHFEMIPTTEVEVVTTSGEFRHTTSNLNVSIASALKRRKEVLSVKDTADHAPVGAEDRLGPVIFAMTPITEVEVVVTLGGLSLVFHDLLDMLVQQCAECASGRQRAALSVRDIVEPAVDGLQQRALNGHYHSVMILIIVAEAVLIVGILIAPHQYTLLSVVQRTVHARIKVE